MMCLCREMRRGVVEKTRRMNFFGGQPAPTGPSPLSSAKTDVEMLGDMFSKMSKMCSKKCITKYNDAELQVGEMTCIDRCTGKYMHAQSVVNDVVQAFESHLKAQKDAAAKFS